MQIRGWVYVISNGAMPGLLKIGLSRKDPKLRAAELGGTGVPQPYVVDYDALVPDPDEVEKKIHQALFEHRGSSGADSGVGTEWFSCSKQLAIETIQRLTEGSRLLESAAPVSVATPQTPGYSREHFYAAALRARCALSVRGGSWTLGKRSLLLTHKSSGRRFRPPEYTYEDGTSIKGFSVKNRETLWVRLEDVEFIE